MKMMGTFNLWRPYHALTLHTVATAHAKQTPDTADICPTSVSCDSAEDDFLMMKAGVEGKAAVCAHRSPPPPTFSSSLPL